MSSVSVGSLQILYNYTGASTSTFRNQEHPGTVFFYTAQLGCACVEQEVYGLSLAARLDPEFNIIKSHNQITSGPIWPDVCMVENRENMTIVQRLKTL